MNFFKNSDYFLTFTALLFADMVTKYFAERGLSLFSGMDVIPNIFSLQLVHNYGAAYGIFQYQRGFLLAVAILVIGICLWLFFSKSSTVLMRWGIIILLVGAFGNFLDRLILGYVVDFIDIKIFPVFNLADLYINLGLALLLVDQIFLYQKKRN